MNHDERERKQFLEAQLEWCKEQECILAEIHGTLDEMKAIVEYVVRHELIPGEVEALNCQLHELTQRVNLLEQKLYVQLH